MTPADLRTMVEGDMNLLRAAIYLVDVDENGDLHVPGEVSQALGRMERRSLALVEAWRHLEAITHLLGTGDCSENMCEGCKYESQAAKDEARAALAKLEELEA